MAPKFAYAVPTVQEGTQTIDRVLDLAQEKKPIHFDVLSKTNLGTKGLGKLLDYLKKIGYNDTPRKNYLEFEHVHACN